MEGPSRDGIDSSFAMEEFGSSREGVDSCFATEEIAQRRSNRLENLSDPITKDGESKTLMKSMDINESQSPPKTKKSCRVRVPRRENSPYRTILDQEEIYEYCVKALACFNETTDGPKYELIKALRCYFTGFPIVHHCNFIARPQHSDNPEDNRLFFGEFKYVGHFTEALVCSISHILGDASIETGPQGCKFCKCDHPVDIGFIKCHEESKEEAMQWT